MGEAEVSGHDFSRAAKCRGKELGFSPWGSRGCPWACPELVEGSRQV